MFETALRYLVDSDDRTETILVGGVLTLFAWLLLPVILVAGYLQRVLARTNAGEEAPSFDDWADLFAEGLKAAAVALAYFAVPVVLATGVLASLLVFSVTTTVSESGVATDPATVVEPVANVGPDPVTVVVVLGSLALAALAALVAWYVLPAALARLAVEGRLSAAFELRTLAGVVTTDSYATGWLVALVVLVVGSAVVSGLATVPVLGWALAPFVAFYANVAAFALYGQGYREATGGQHSESVDASRETTA